MLLRLVAEVDPAHLVPLLLQPIHHACTQAALIDDGQRRLVLLDGLDDVPDHFHRVSAAQPLDVDQVASLPHRDDGGVAAEPCRIDADGDGRRLVLVLGPLHGIVHQIDRDELVVAF